MCCAPALRAARMNAAHPTIAIGLEFDAIAAVETGRNDKPVEPVVIERVSVS